MTLAPGQTLLHFNAARAFRVDVGSGASAGLRYAVATITPSGKYWTLSVAKLLADLYVAEGLK